MSSGEQMDADAINEALLELVDAIDAHASRRAQLERFVAAALSVIPANVSPEDAARLAWTRALAALRWADDHAEEVAAAARPTTDPIGS